MVLSWIAFYCVYYKNDDSEGLLFIMSETIGQKLRILRYEKNLTQQQVADMVGFAVNSLSRYERDTRPIPMDIALRLADFYEVDVKIFIL